MHGFGPTGPVPCPTGTRPRDTDPGGDDLALSREDLLATASTRYGREALNEALGAPFYLIAKRFAGMAPPPPPGAGPDWIPPTPSALLMKREQGWMIATESGWRPIDGNVAAELNQAIGDPRLWSEPAFVPPCPDYGASVLLLLKVPGRSASVRKSTCNSNADKVVFAALRA
jgi:hypothetical protein